MDTNFDLPPEFVNEMRAAMSGERIELPFAAPHLWWLNGKPAYKQTGSAPYFGGWAVNVDEMDNAVANAGLTVPKRFTKATLSNAKGEEFDVYVVRGIPAAVIAKRNRWVVDEERGGKGRGHVQVLAYMADYVDKAFIPWGPVVLSGKGMAGKSIETAFLDFDKATGPARRQVARTLPAWFFYSMIGTFGDKPETTMVGPTGTQSPITPAKFYNPGEINGDTLKKWYVGAEVAAMMVDFKHQAKDWLEAWKKPAANGDDFVPEPPPSFNDEPPF